MQDLRYNRFANLREAPNGNSEEKAEEDTQHNFVRCVKVSGFRLAGTCLSYFFLFIHITTSTSNNANAVAKANIKVSEEFLSFSSTKGSDVTSSWISGYW